MWPETKCQRKLIPKSRVIVDVQQLYNLLLSICWLYRIEYTLILLVLSPWNLSLMYFSMIISMILVPCSGACYGINGLCF